MNDNQSRRLTALGKALMFANLHPSDFPAGGKAAQLLNEIRNAESEAQSGAAGQESGHGSMKAGTATKADLYDELYEDLRAINRTAKAIAADEPGGLEEKFRMPRSPSYAQVLTTARAFLTDAAPLSAKFLEYEMPADFLTDLAEDIAAFDEAEDDQGAGLTNRVGATRTVAQAITAGIAALRQLDPVMRNKYRNDPVRLAEWLSASHVERTPKNKKEDAAPTV
jgi:hypothetical protein